MMFLRKKRLRMRQKINLFLCLFLFMVSCQKRDFVLLSEDELASVIAEINILEAMFDDQNIRDKNERTLYYQSVMDKYGISHNDMQKSAAYYSEKSDKMEEIYSLSEQKIIALTDSVKSYVFHPEEDPNYVPKDTTTLNCDFCPFLLRDSSFFIQEGNNLLLFYHEKADFDSVPFWVNRSLLQFASSLGQ